MNNEPNDGKSPTSRALRCPLCRGPVFSHAFSDQIGCEACTITWSYERYVSDCASADRPRMVWVNQGKHTFTMLVHKDDLLEDVEGRYVVIENKRCMWWPL